MFKDSQVNWIIIDQSLRVRFLLEILKENLNKKDWTQLSLYKELKIKLRRKLLEKCEVLEEWR